MRRRVPVIFACAAIAIGVGLMLYPFASNLLYQRAADQVSLQQAQQIQATSDELLEDERRAAVAYNRDLRMYPASANDPFSNLDGVSQSRYDSLVNIAGDGVMGSLEVPTAGIRLPIYHGVAADTLTRGAGHVPGSSLPVGGKGTHAIIAAHTGLPSARMFDDLDKVKVGDVFRLYVLGRELYYRVDKVEVRLPDDLGYFTIESGSDLLTLVTCTPYGVNDHRLLVTGERCAKPADWDDASAADPVGIPRVPVAVVCAAVIAAAALALLIRRRLRRTE